MTNERPDALKSNCRPVAPHVVMDWEAPEPRSGLWGAWDRFVGPGYTRAELQFWASVSLAGSIAAVAYPFYVRAPWSWWQYLIALMIAGDIWGGAAVNASAPAKRWYHRPGVGPANHVAFVGVHTVHIAVVAAFFRQDLWSYFLIFFCSLAICTTLVLLAPLYLRRPVAAVGAATGISVLAAGPGLTPFMEWFEPVMFMKLIVGYLVFEAPFRDSRL